MEDKKQVLAGVTMFMMALFILVCVHWIVEMKLMDTQGDSLMPQAMFYIYNKFKDKILLLRFAFVICLWGFYYVNTWHKVNKNETPESMMWWRIYGLMVSLLMVVGTINLYYYDLLIYPVLLFLGFLFIGKAASPFRKSGNSTTGVGISQKEENDMSFTIGTDQGPLVIHAPQQGIAVEGGAGSGKCLLKGTKVILFDGTLKKVEDVKIGDELMGSDSTKRTVLQLSNGVGMLYKVKQSMGEEYVVNANHILSLKKIDYVKMKKGDLNAKGIPTKNKTRYSSYDDYVDIPVLDFMVQSEKFRRCFLGYRTQIEYPHKEVLIDPYFLGLWIGDGCSESIKITTEDQEIAECFLEEANNRNLKIRLDRKIGNTAFDLAIVNGQGKNHKKGKTLLEFKNPILEDFRSYNLVNNKHIPLEYLANSRKIRLELLAGILDTDGYMDNNYYTIIQKNELLSEQIQLLAASLGFRTFIRKKKKSIRRIGFVGEYYEVSIAGHLNELPVRLERKKTTILTKNKNPFVNTLSIEEYGIGEYYGFEIDGDHRFLLKDGTVTHNSASCVEPILEQAVWKDFSGVVYDFKGNPPTLGKTVYSAMLRRKQQGKEGKVKLALLNFMDLTRSVRCNPIDPDYIDSKLFASEIAFTMMVNLQKDWREKQDFWASNAISYVEGIIWMLKKHKPEYCTIPHVVAIGLNSVETVLNYLSTDMEVGMMMKPLMDAFKNKAANQIAGVSASAQLPIKKLFTPEIFWVLSKPDISLDVNNIENPIMLCVANDPQLQEALGAAIAVVLTTCFKNMNQQGKQKSIIAIDELPTIYINKLDNIPATARSNKVVTLLAYQSYAQLERDYGKQNAEVIIGNLGNQMTGMTNELRTAERIEKTFGQYKVKDYSHSESDSGLSTTESNKLEKVIQAKEILGQKIGHFTGKIAGGEPPFFSAQFDYYDLEKFDIPQSCAIDTGDEKMNKEIMNSLAIENFDRINREAQELLAPFEPQTALD